MSIKNTSRSSSSGDKTISIKSSTVQLEKEINSKIRWVKLPSKIQRRQIRDESSDDGSVCSHASAAQDRSLKKVSKEYPSTHSIDKMNSSFESEHSPDKVGHQQMNIQIAEKSNVGGSMDNSPTRSPGKLMSSYRLPQFFQQSEEQIERFQRKSTKRKINLIRQATKTKLAEDPDELVKDMADFLQQVGYTSSFIDKDYGQKPNLWQVMTRGITNELSFEHQIFQDNLQPKKMENVIYKKQQDILLKQKLKSKRGINQPAFEGPLNMNKSQQGETSRSKKSTVRVAKGSTSPTTVKRATATGKFALSQMGEDFTQAVQDQKAAVESSPHLSQQQNIQRNLSSTKGWTPSVAFTKDQLKAAQRQASSPHRTKLNLSDIALPGTALMDSIKKQKRDLQKLQKEKKDEIKQHFRGDNHLNMNQYPKNTRHTSNDYGKAVEIKKQQIEFNEYIQNDQMRKRLLAVVQNGQVTKKYADGFATKMFQNEAKPGISPVKEMINGHNQELYFSQYNKQYRYLDDLPKKVPSLSKSPKLPKISISLRETGMSRNMHMRHARTKSQIDMLNPNSQIEILESSTSQLVLPLPLQSSAYQLMLKDQPGDRVIKIDKIITTTSLENLDYQIQTTNPTVLNSRVDTTESTLRQDTSMNHYESVQSALSKLKNIRGQINQFYNVDAAIGKSNKTSKQSNRKNKIRTGSEAISFIDIKENLEADSWTELQTNYNKTKKLKKDNSYNLKSKESLAHKSQQLRKNDQQRSLQLFPLIDMKMKESDILLGYYLKTNLTPNLAVRNSRNVANLNTSKSHVPTNITNPSTTNRHRVYNSQDQMSIQDLIQAGQTNILGLTTNESSQNISLNQSLMLKTAMKQRSSYKNVDWRGQVRKNKEKQRSQFTTQV